MEPYGISATGYVTFEDPHSSAVKSRWVMDNGYAGIMVWEVSHDYIEGVGNPILDSIAVVLRNNSTTAIKPFCPQEMRKANGSTGKNASKKRATDLKGRSVPSKAAHGAYYPVKAK